MWGLLFVASNADADRKLALAADFSILQLVVFFLGGGAFFFRISPSHLIGHVAKEKKERQHRLRGRCIWEQKPDTEMIQR